VRGALERALHAEAECAALRRRAQQRAAAYSWDSTARRTLAVYEEVMEQNRAAA